MRGTSTGVGLGLSGTSCPKEYGGCTLVLPSFRACSFPVFLNLRTMPIQRSIPKARLPPATRKVGSGTEVESCTGRLVAFAESLEKIFSLSSLVVGACVEGGSSVSAGELLDSVQGTPVTSWLHSLHKPCPNSSWARSCTTCFMPLQASWMMQ